MARPASVHGVVVVDKPGGMTSHDVVARCRRIFGQRQVGHAGTLDPDATGVLVIGLGDATRLLRWLSESRKVYRGTVAFGTSTTTLDAAGAVVEQVAMPVSQAEVEQVASSFVGDILQIPPMVSSIKIGGRRLHELAREGVEVERPPRPVTIHRLDVGEFDASTADAPRVVIDVECSSGTYIRTLAADLGVALGGVAHLESLRRLAVGSFTLDEATPLAELEATPAVALGAVLAPAAAMRAYPECQPSPEVLDRVRHGAPLFASELGIVDETSTELLAVLDASDRLVAVYERWRADRWKPAVVLAANDTAS